MGVPFSLLDPSGNSGSASTILDLVCGALSVYTSICSSIRWRSFPIGDCREGGNS